MRLAPAHGGALEAAVRAQRAPHKPRRRPPSRRGWQRTLPGLPTRGLPSFCARRGSTFMADGTRVIGWSLWTGRSTQRTCPRKRIRAKHGWEGGARGPTRDYGARVVSSYCRTREEVLNRCVCSVAGDLCSGHDVSPAQRCLTWGLVNPNRITGSGSCLEQT